MRLVVHKSIPESEDLRSQWNALLETVDRPQVFYTYEWSLAVQRAYRASMQPLLFLGYDDGESLIGVAALAAEGDRATFLCANTGDYCDFLCSSEDTPAFVSSVLDELRKQGIRSITLTNLPADSRTLPAIRAARKDNSYHCFARTAYVCAQVSLETIERRPDNTPVLPRKKMVRRFLNAMGREAPVRLDHARSWEQIEPLLSLFSQAHVARFLITGRISNLVRRERRVFLGELAQLLAESGWIRLTRLAAGNKNYAWNYGFLFRDTWFWYQPTFDSDIEKYSPGYCLLAKIIEEAAANPVLKLVDLGLGAEEYKDRFSNQPRRTLYVTLRISAADHAREILRYVAGRVVRLSAPVENALRAGEARLRRLQGEISRDGLRVVASRAPRRLGESLWLEEEVFFYEWCGSLSQRMKERLAPLGAEELATAAMQYEDDSETLQYLLRCASRLRAGTARGFGLTDAEGTYAHFAWITDFDGFFLSELNAKVDAPARNCVMLFDCWTPKTKRGRGYYADAVSRVAESVRSEGKTAWIFSAARNVASVRGLEKTGFQRRYSLTRQRILLWQRIKGETPRLAETPAKEVSARV